MIRALLIAVLLAGCGGDSANRFADIDSCNDLIRAFEQADVPPSEIGRQKLGDEYRERFRELDCSL